MTLLAHGGGAPEAAMIGLPLLLLLGFLLLERRARRAEASRAGDDASREPGEPEPFEG